MSKRKGSLFDALLLVPWWASLLLGIAFYFGVHFVAPAILAKVPILAASAKSAEPIALLLLGVFCVAALFSAIRAKALAKQWDRQRSVQDLAQLTWQQFESLMGECFRRQGYRVQENGGGGADGGVDLVLFKDGNRYLVQCKQWRTLKVGVKPIRELQGVVAAEGAAGGLFVTVGHYTDDARRFAASCGMTLLDASSLADMLRDRVSQPEANPQTTPSRSVARSNTDGPTCPDCGKTMVTRTASRGSNAGKQFWGCSAFPACRATRDIS